MARVHVKFLVHVADVGLGGSLADYQGALYVVHAAAFGRQYEDLEFARRELVEGRHRFAALFWGGAVACGLVAPAAAGAAALVRRGAGVRLACGAVGLLFALAGFACCGAGLAALG